MAAQCQRCNGWFYRDFEGETCLMCGRPAVKPTPPAWLLQETEVSTARHNSDQYFSALVEREARTLREAMAAGRRVWA